MNRKNQNKMGDRTQVNRFDIVGRVLFVGKPIWISEKFTKAFLVMEVYVDNKYKQEVPFEFVNDYAPLIASVRVGDWVEVVFVLRSRKKVGTDAKAHWWPSNSGIACTVIERKS